MQPKLNAPGEKKQGLAGGRGVWAAEKEKKSKELKKKEKKKTAGRGRGRERGGEE